MRTKITWNRKDQWSKGTESGSAGFWAVIGRCSAWDLAVTLIDRRIVDLSCSSPITKITRDGARAAPVYLAEMFRSTFVFLGAACCVAAEAVSIRDYRH